MENTECLAGMQCPECDSLGPFDIVITTTARVYDDGVEDTTDAEWNADSSCCCTACSFTATVRDFEFDDS